MKKSEITSFFNVYNKIQKIVDELDMRSPYQYNVRIKQIKKSNDGPFDYIHITLDIFNDCDTEDGLIYNIFIPIKFLNDKNKNELRELIETWVKQIQTNIYKISIL